MPFYKKVQSLCLQINVEISRAICNTVRGDGWPFHLNSCGFHCLSALSCGRKIGTEVSWEHEWHLTDSHFKHVNVTNLCRCSQWLATSSERDSWKSGVALGYSRARLTIRQAVAQRSVSMSSIAPNLLSVPRHNFIDVHNPKFLSSHIHHWHHLKLPFKKEKQNLGLPCK